MLLILFLTLIWAVGLGLFTLLFVQARSDFLTSAPVEKFFNGVAQLFAQISKHPHICGASIVAFVIVLRLSVLCVLPIPLPGVHDEHSYLLGADTFASGRWTNPTPKAWQFFETEHVLVKPTYMSKYPPGQACILAIGKLLGNAWYGVLINFALMCGAIYWMALAYLPPKWALVAGLLPLVQPGISSYWCNSYWGGSLSATGTALVFGACARLATRLSSFAACLLAVGLVLVANSRPFEGLVAISLPMLVCLIRIVRRGKLAAIRHHILLPILIVGVCASAMLYFNFRVTGNAFLMPHVLFHTQYERTPLWHGKPLYPEPVYHNQQMKDFWTIEDVTLFQKRQTFEGWFDGLQNEVILGYFSVFIGPWMIPLAAAALLSVRDRRVRVLWLTMGMMSLAVAFELYLHYFERHYLAPIMAANYVLLAQGLRHLRFLKVRGKPVGLVLARCALISACLGFVIGLLTLPSLREGTARAQATLAAPRAQIIEQLSALPGKHLVIVHYANGHDPGFEWVFNAADIDNAKVVWARDFGAKNKELFDCFPDRKIWLVDADSRPPHLYTFEESKTAPLTTKYPDQWTW